MLYEILISKFYIRKHCYIIYINVCIIIVVAEETNASVFTSASNQEVDICDYGDETDENRFQKSFDSILGVQEENIPKQDEGEGTEDTKLSKDAVVSVTQINNSNDNTNIKDSPVQDVDK